MTSDELVLKLEANDIDAGYMLLPYIKVNETILDDTQITNDSILYVPIGDSLISQSNSIISITSEPDILNDHNYFYNTLTETGKSENIAFLYDVNEEINEKQQQCTHCNKILTNPAALVRHLRIHTGEQPFQCQLCSKRFTQQSNLWKHVLIHTGERKFKCQFCDKKFSQRANMEKHLRIHTGEKPYVCPVCERGFTQRANLTKHQRTHTGEKPYSCKYCNKQFAQLSNKQKHEILHKGIKPYACTICHVAFSQQSNLKKHILTHNSTPEINTCKICKKVYLKRKTYLKHKGECNMNHVMKGKIIKNEPVVGFDLQKSDIKSENYCDILIADE